MKSGLSANYKAACRLNPVVAFLVLPLPGCGVLAFGAGREPTPLALKADFLGSLRNWLHPESSIDQRLKVLFEANRVFCYARRGKLNNVSSSLSLAEKRIFSGTIMIAFRASV